MSTDGEGQHEVALATFEGLFDRTLKPEGRFRQELREAGYDLDAPKAYYSGEVWHRAVEVATKHATPGKPREEALRILGRRMADGFFQTLVGTVIAVGMPMLGAERVVQRLPRYLASTARGVAMTIERTADRTYLFRSRDPHALPELLAGVIEAGMARMKAQATVRVVERDPGGYALEIRW